MSKYSHGTIVTTLRRLIINKGDNKENKTVFPITDLKPDWAVIIVTTVTSFSDSHISDGEFSCCAAQMDTQSLPLKDGSDLPSHPSLGNICSPRCSLFLHRGHCASSHPVGHKNRRDS